MTLKKNGRSEKLYCPGQTRQLGEKYLYGTGNALRIICI